MKRITLKTLLAVAGMFIASTAWAEGEVSFTKGNTIGDENNSGDWYYGKSEIFEIPANKTLTLKFKTYSATDEQLTAAEKTWGAHMSHVINLWGGDANLFWRADGYGWHAKDPEENTNGSGWFKYLGSNTRWGDGGAEFRADITGSDVVFTIARYGAELRMTQDIFAASGNYRRYFVVDYGNAGNSIWAQLAVERAHLTVSEDYSITDTEIDPTITGTLVGIQNNTTPFWTQWTDYFTIAPEKSLTLKYKSYTNRIQNYYGGIPYVTTDYDRGATEYVEYFGLRPDNWVNVANKNATSCNFDVIGWNWSTFREKLDGATVTMTITRAGANVTIREEFAPADGSTTLYEEYNQDCGDGTQNIRVFLTVEGAHIDLLPVTKTISTAGWATLCSEYALDFTGTIANLEAAYAITGHSGSTLTLTPISQVVAAGEGILLKGSGECKFPIKGSGTAVSGNLLKGNLTETSKDAESIYVLMDETDGVGFYKNKNAFTVGANTAYLNASDMSAAPEFLAFFDSETTGIKSVRQSTAAFGDFFDMQGRRVAKPAKGLYIMNGKKVAIK